MLTTIWLCCALLLFSANGLDAFLDFTATCAPRPTVVRIEHYPYFVLLHRCGGSCGSHPSLRSCAELTHTEVQVPVLDLVNGSGHKLIPMQNHTGCSCGCVRSPMDCHPVLEEWKESRCQCECKYPKAPPKDLACKSGFKWDPTTCRCQCDTPPKICPPRKEWSSGSCGCVCTKRIVNRCTRKQKGLDHEQCECVDVQALRRENTGSVNSKTFVTVIVFLSFLVVVLAAATIFTCHKTRRARAHTISYPREEIHSPKPPPSRSDSGNISCSNGSVVCDSSSPSKATCVNYQTDSNGSVCMESITEKESTL